MSRIEILPPQARWPADFAHVRAQLAAALGELALRIDHIGSTSVPALAAKDRIDVQVGVRALGDVVTIAMQMLPAFESRPHHQDHVPPGCDPDPVQWRKQLFACNGTRPPVNVHVRVVGAANWRYALLFRDYLRAEPRARGAYAQLKQALARLHPDDADAYYDVKDPACDLIMAGAEHWALRTGWMEQNAVTADVAITPGEAKGDGNIGRKTLVLARVYAGADRETHFDTLSVPLALRGEIGWLSVLQPGSGVIFRETGPDYDYDFHCAPRKQFVVMLSGHVAITVSDGERREFRTGDVFLLEDVAPSKGHRTTELSGGTRRTLFLPRE